MRKNRRQTSDVVKHPHEYGGQDELDKGEVVFPRRDPVKQRSEMLYEVPMIPQESLVKDYLYTVATDRWHPDADYNKVWLRGSSGIDDIYLASLAAKKFDLPDLLKDPNHPVWEWIDDVAERAEDWMNYSGSKRRHSTSYNTEVSSPMFRSDGESELELTVADEITEDPEMMDLIDTAYVITSLSGPTDWDKMADYVQSIYNNYGESPELANQADWNFGDSKYS